MSKRILFCIENFQHGGINKALENLLAVFDHDRYDVGLFVVNREDGPYKELFSPYLKYDKDPLLKAVCTHYHKYSGIKKYGLLGFKLARKLLARIGYDPFNLRLDKWARRISQDGYDCVIAFAEGYVTEFVSKVSGHKIAWIHIDYKRYLTYVGSPDEGDIYARFDNVVIPSRFSGVSFVQSHPSLEERVCVIPNVIDSASVRQQVGTNTDSDPRFVPGVFSIVSVGRVCYEKRFFEIPVIAKSLKAMGAEFRWYIIGDGSPVETDTLSRAIDDNGVRDCVIPLGRKDNPYPYIAESDILVSTSLSETFSYVIFEAKSLGVPVVCADFGTASEIISEGEGIIAPISLMAGSIFKLYRDRDCLQSLKTRLNGYSYDYDSVLDKIYSIL